MVVRAEALVPCTGEAAMLARFGRWWIAGAIGALVVSSLGVATSWSYLKTLWRGVGETIRDATPISFDLQRLDGMIRDLEPEIRRNQQVVAQLEVECEYLDREVKAMQAQQQEAMAQMRKLREALDEPKSEYVFAGQSYTRSQVESDLAQRLDQYEQRKDQLAAKEQLLQQRRRTLEAAMAKVIEYRRQYNDLVAKAESLQAELKLAEAAQAAGKLQFDSSKLGDAKQLAQNIEKRIRVLQKLVESDRQPDGAIPVEADSRPVTQRFDELFGSPHTAAHKPASGT
jgi:phage shock protein A